MIKMNFQTDEKTVNEFIKSLQEELPIYDINVFNACEFLELLEDRKACVKCNCLEDCKNKTKGYYKAYDEESDSFYYACCKKLKNINLIKKKQSLIKTLYLPQKVLDARLEDFDTNSESRKKIYKQLLDFIQNYKQFKKAKGLYLYGSFSIGKTYTLSVIASELAKNDISCLLIYFPDLVLDLKNALTSNRYADLINELKSVDVLMLDDLGSENMTPWLRDEVIGPIINYRLLEGKPLFISSNISPKDLKDIFITDNSKATYLKAERITSRLNGLLNTISMDDSLKYSR